VTQSSAEAVQSGRMTSPWTWERLKPYALFPLLGVLALFMVYPIFMVVYASFKGGPPGTDAPFTLDGYGRVWSQWRTYKALIMTIGLALVRTGLSVAFAIVFTWILTRTNTPGRGVFENFIWLRIFLPPLPVILAWLFLASGRGSLINRLLMDTFNLANPPLDIRSLWGLIFLSVVFAGAIFYVFIGPAFRNMDASMEESSRTCGASNLTTLFRITVPVMMPAILGTSLLAFLFVLSSFEMELFLLAPKGIYVFTTYIWYLFGTTPIDYPGAMATANIFLIFVAGVIYLQFRILGGRQFVTVTGRGFNVRPTDLGRWKWVAFGIMVAWVIVGVLLPVAALVLSTFLKGWGLIDSGLTTQYWKLVFRDPATIKAFKNTLVLAALVATGSTVVHGLLSYAYLRTRLKGRALIEVLTWVPRASPGIVLAVGIYWAVLGGIPGLKLLFGSIFLMAIVVMIDSTPVAMRLLNGAMVQLGAELEESARVSGASWLQTMRRVVLPLLAPALVNNWLLRFFAASQALILILYIVLPGSNTVPVLMFQFMMSSGDQQRAAALGVALSAICLVAAILARIVVARERRVMEVV